MKNICCFPWVTTHGTRSRFLIKYTPVRKLYLWLFYYENSTTYIWNVSSAGGIKVSVWMRMVHKRGEVIGWTNNNSNSNRLWVISNRLCNVTRKNHQIEPRRVRVSDSLRVQKTKATSSQMCPHSYGVLISNTFCFSLITHQSSRMSSWAYLKTFPLYVDIWHIQPRNYLRNSIWYCWVTTVTRISLKLFRLYDTVFVSRRMTRPGW